MQRVANKLLNQLLPGACSFCDSPLKSYSENVCQDCYQALPWAKQPGATLGELSAFYYLPPIDQAILTGKTGKQLDSLQLLGKLLADNFNNRIHSYPQAILPVPLHTSRLRQRGFNQSLELARPLAKKLGIPLLKNAVQRIKQTEDQKQLKASERLSNIEGSFQLQSPLPYQHVAIFDDVITTGATCITLKKLLLESGVRTVQIWCCATTKHDHTS